MTNEEIIKQYAAPRNYVGLEQMLDLARADEREKLSKEGVSEIKAGDFVIDENYKLLQISSIEQRGNGNLRYNFTNGNFGLKDETSLGNPNNLYKKVEVSTDERAKLSKGGVRVFVSSEEHHAKLFVGGDNKNVADIKYTLNATEGVFTESELFPSKQDLLNSL